MMPYFAQASPPVSADPSRPSARLNRSQFSSAQQLSIPYPRKWISDHPAPRQSSKDIRRNPAIKSDVVVDSFWSPPRLPGNSGGFVPARAGFSDQHRSGSSLESAPNEEYSCKDSPKPMTQQEVIYRSKFGDARIQMERGLQLSNEYRHTMPSHECRAGRNVVDDSPTEHQDTEFRTRFAEIEAAYNEARDSALQAREECVNRGLNVPALTLPARLKDALPGGTLLSTFQEKRPYTFQLPVREGFMLKGKNYFAIGKVFEADIVGLANDVPVTINSGTSSSYYMKARYYIVIEQRIDHFAAIGMFSYGNKGVPFKGLKSEHCIVYSNDKAPLTPLKSEQPHPGEPGLKPMPIRVERAHPESAHLRDHVRLNLGKEFSPLPYNQLPVKHYGRVDRRHLAALIQQWTAVREERLELVRKSLQRDGARREVRNNARRMRKSPAPGF